jgi:hypothetical protein
VNSVLHREQELARRRGDREVGGIELRERPLAGEDAEVVNDLIEGATRCFGGPCDQVEKPLVGVGLAEQVDRLVREELTGEVDAVGLGQVVAEAREDDAVQDDSILCATTRVGFPAERPGPVAQPVFKTGEVWQPQAG